MSVLILIGENRWCFDVEHPKIGALSYGLNNPPLEIEIVWGFPPQKFMQVSP